MIKEFDPRSSLEDIAAQVPVVREAFSCSDVSSAEEERIEEWEGVIGRRTAAAAARWNTGRRTNDERHDLMRTNQVRMEWIRERVLKLAHETYDDSGDTDLMKRTILGCLEETQEQMVAWDYEMRLESSGYERLKKWLAQRPLERVGVPLALSAMANTAAFRIMEISSSHVDLSAAERGGLFGVTYLMASLAINAAQRNGPPQIGMAFRNLSSASLRTYMLDSLGITGDDDDEPTLDEMLRCLAKRDLVPWNERVARSCQLSVVSSREDIAPMVGTILHTAETAMYEGYGIDPEEDGKPWPKRMLGRLALAN